MKSLFALFVGLFLSFNVFAQDADDDTPAVTVVKEYSGPMMTLAGAIKYISQGNGLATAVLVFDAGVYDALVASGQICPKDATNEDALKQMLEIITLAALDPTNRTQEKMAQSVAAYLVPELKKVYPCAK